MGRYAEEFHRSLADPDGFWGEAARAIDWYREPSTVLDASNPSFSHWFPDGVLNTCFNALDRHVRDGRGGRPRSSTTARSPAPSGRTPTPSCWTRSPGSPGCCAAWAWTRATG